MRIAFVHSFYSSRQPSGENLIVEAEVAALRRAGHEVRLFGRRTGELEHGPAYRARAALRVATGFGASPVADIRDFAPDIVHVHNLFPNYGRRWVRQVNRPLVASVHNYRPLCANGMLLRDGHSCTLCPSGAPWSGLRYACYRESRTATLPLSVANRRGPDHDALFARADRLIFSSDPQRQLYSDAGAFLDKSVVWPNFLPQELDPGSAHPGDRTGSWLFVGRLSAEKGIRELIEVWPATTPLKVIGDGPLLTELRDRARGKLIAFAGAFARSRVIAEMSQSVGLVFASLCMEAFPLVYLEALAGGLPVLAFGDNVVSRMVRQDDTGWTSHLPRELESLLTTTRAYAPQLRQHCRNIFETRYSEHAHLQRAHALYESLLGQARDSRPTSKD